MKTYIETLRSEVQEAKQHEQSKLTRLNTDLRILCSIPLTSQIKELMQSLPPAQRDRAWSMEEFVARLHGRYSARPHPMNVGQALRALGWAQERDWSQTGGGRRYWRQPSERTPLNSL